MLKKLFLALVACFSIGLAGISAEASERYGKQKVVPYQLSWW